MNELEKCMAGEYYDCHDKIFLDFKTQARELLKEYNSLAYEQKQEKTGILKQLFGSIGSIGGTALYLRLRAEHLYRK